MEQSIQKNTAYAVEMKDIVKKFGCRLIQGYLIDKAVPYEKAIELLERYNKKK